jgi:hypothetical protein
MDAIPHSLLFVVSFIDRVFEMGPSLFQGVLLSVYVRFMVSEVTSELTETRELKLYRLNE